MLGLVLRGSESVQVIVAVVAFATAVYTFYKSFLERARIRLLPGDRVGLVLSSGGGCTTFHLRGSIVNEAIKTGTVHRLEAQIMTPSAARLSYEWKLLFDYVPGTLDVQPASNPIPLSVPGKSSQLLLVEFGLTDPELLPAWPAGSYELEITGWVNKPNRSRPPNLHAAIHFSLDIDQAGQLASQVPSQATVVDVPVREWIL